MAWRSSGTTNDEMVDNLKRFGVISSPALERAFRNVDRRFFVPKGTEDVAHTDQPLKEGNVHISAPHIYGAALEALELKTNSSLSFLNIGSGTGYVSCIVADVLGMCSSNYGIEVHPDVITHSKAAIQRWTTQRSKNARSSPFPSIEILHGNGLHIDHTEGEAVVGFDRIYVGAAVEKRNLPKLTRLLRPGGILVGPVDDELVKVVRMTSSDESSSSNQDVDGANDSFTQQVLSGVRFASLICFPKIVTVIPSQVWEPSAHRYYPDSFRCVCKELLLCSNSDYVQPPQIQEALAQRVNLAAMLPKAIWIEIMSFTHRSWFERPQTEETFLRQRLMEEQTERRKANEARLEAETRLHIAERERDVYRLLARRWQSRFQALLRQRTEANSSDGSSSLVDIDEAASVLLNGRGHPVVFGLGGMRLHLLQSEDENEEDSVDNESNVAMEERQIVAMEEDDEDDEDAELEFHEASNGEDHFGVAGEEDDVRMDEDIEEAMLSVSPGTASAIASRPQVRAISISSDDLY